MPSQSGLPYPVGPQSSWIFVFLTSPTLAHHFTLFTIPSVTLFQVHTNLSFHLKWAAAYSAICSSTRLTFLKKPAVSSLHGLGWGSHIPTGGKSTVLSLGFKIFYTLPFKKDSPLFSAPARLVESFFPEVCFNAFLSPHVCPYHSPR